MRLLDLAGEKKVTRRRRGFLRPLSREVSTYANIDYDFDR